MSPLTLNEVMGRARNVTILAGNVAGASSNDLGSGPCRIFSMNVIGDSYKDGSLYNSLTVGSGDKIILRPYPNYSFTKSWGTAGIRFATGLSIEWEAGTSATDELAVTWLPDPD